MKKKTNLPTIKKVDETKSKLMFAEATIRAQQQRHSALNDAFDKALKIVDNLLDDPTQSDAVKLFPAKLAIETYLAKEKLLREDAKYDLDRERIEIERAKLSVPGGPLYIIQQVENQQNNQVNVQSKSKESLKDRKHLQAQLLEKVSGIKQLIDTSEKDK